MKKTPPFKFKNIFLINNSEPEMLSDKRAIEMMDIAEKVSFSNKGDEALMCLMQPGNVPEIIIAGRQMQDMDISDFLTRFADLPEWVSGFCKVYLLLPAPDPQKEEQDYRHYKLSKTMHRPLCVYEILEEQTFPLDFN